MRVVELPASQPARGPNLWLRVVLPFSVGYFLSYLYRTVNAVLAPQLTAAVGLSAADLGLLTSVYFLSFGLVQLPLGILLDRFGARRVESGLLLAAAAGAWLFAAGASREELILGRVLIGFGVSACLMASFKAFSQWFPIGRWPALNGVVMASGGLGALVSTVPVEAALRFTSWRGVFAGLAVATVAVAGVLYLVVPERKTASASQSLREQWQGVAAIFRSRPFWTLAPLMMMSQSCFIAILGLWAGPWLRDVAGLSGTRLALHLLTGAAAMVIGHLLLGNFATRLSHRGLSYAPVVGVGSVAFMLAQIGMAAGWGAGAGLLLFVFGFFGTCGTLIYPLLAQEFPPEMAGRSNTALNQMFFLGAFVAQWAIGGIIDLWPQGPAGYPEAAYRWAFGLPLILQAAALGWFVWRWRSTTAPE